MLPFHRLGACESLGTYKCKLKLVVPCFAGMQKIYSTRRYLITAISSLPVVSDESDSVSVQKNRKRAPLFITKQPIPLATELEQTRTQAFPTPTIILLAPQSKLRLRLKRLPLRQLPQILAQNLAGRALRDGLDEGDAAPQALVVGHVLRDVVLDLLGRNGRGFLVSLAAARCGDDVGAGNLGAFGRHADDGGVKDGRVGEQQGLELGGGDLEAFVFDEFLCGGDGLAMMVTGEI